MTLFNDPVHPVWQHCIWWLYAVTLFDDTVWWTYVMALHDGPVWWSWIVLLCLLVFVSLLCLSLFLLASVVLLPTLWLVTHFVFVFTHSLRCLRPLCFCPHCGLFTLLAKYSLGSLDLHFLVDPTFMKKMKFDQSATKNFSSRIARHGGNRLGFFFG